MKDAPKAAVGSRLKRPALIAAGLLVGVGLLHWLCVFDRRQGKALEQLGAEVRRDWTRLGRPIIVVYLPGDVFNPRVKPISEDDVIHELKGLVDLRKLYLWGWSVITDKTLSHLPELGLSQLRLLDIQLTGISGDGLKYVKELPALQELWLSGTRGA